MSNLSVVIGADTTGLTQAISSAQDVLNKYVSTSKSASAEIKKNANVTESQVTAFKRVVDALEKANSGSMTTTQQQKALKTQITELRAQWEGLSNEARQSDFGKAMSASLSSAQQQLANVTNTIKSVTSDMGGKKELPLKGQLKQLTTQLTELTAKYRAMSQAEKESTGGQELAAKMDELREKAGTLKDTIGDVSAEIAVMASDTPNLDVFNDLLGLSADALQTYSGFLAKVTGDEESLKDMIATVTMVQGAANTMTKLTNALQSSSTIMLKLRSIQEGLAAKAIAIRTAAEGKSTIAIKAATIAQRAFNLVAKANPYVLLATAVVAVGTALYAFSKNIGKAKKEQEELNEVQDRATKINESLAEAHEEANNQASEGIVKINALYAIVKDSNAAYEDRKKALDKLKSIVPEYHGSLSKEGQLINDNSTAIKNYVKHLGDMATAQAYYNKLIKLQSDILNARDQKEQKRLDAMEKDAVVSKLVAKGDGPETYVRQDRETGLEITEVTAGTAAYRRAKKQASDAWDAVAAAEQAEKNAQAAFDRVSQEAANDPAVRKAFNDLITKDEPSGNGGKGGNGSGGKGGHSSESSELEAAKGSLADLEKQLSDLQEKAKKGLLGKFKISDAEYAQKVAELTDQIKKKKEEIEALEGKKKSRMSVIEEEIKSKQESLQFETDPTNIKSINKEIERLTNEKRRIEIDLMPEGLDKIEKQLEYLNNLRTSILSSDDYDSEESKKRLQTIDTAIKEVEKHKTELELRINLTANETELSKQLHTLVSEFTEAQSMPLSLQIQTYGVEKITELGNAYNSALNEFIEFQKEIDNANYSSPVEALEAMDKLNNLGAKLSDAANAYGAVSIKPAVSVEDWSAQVDLLSDYIKKLDELKDKMEEFGLTGTTAYSDLITVMGQLQEGLNTSSEGLQNVTDSTKKTEKLTTQMDVLGSCVSSAASAFSSLGSSFKLPALDIVGIIAGAIASVLQGYATASAQASSMGPIAWAAFSLAGLAQVAAVIGQIHSLSGYANGGIIKGATNIGDYNLARVNNGEMILNGSQQARLYKMATGAFVPQSAGGGVGQVEFKIKGSTLVGAIDNYQKKISKY